MVIFLGAATVALAAAPGPGRVQISVRDIVEVADVSSVAASPDGQWVAYRTEKADVASDDVRSQWWVAAVDGRTPARAIANGGVPLRTMAGTIAPEMPLWSRSSTALFFRAQIDGALQIWKADIAGSSAVHISNDEGDVRSFKLALDGLSLEYTAAPSRSAIAEAERRISAEGTLVDATVDMGQAIAGGRIRNGKRSLERFTGSWFDRAGLMWDAPGHRVSVDLKTGLSSPVARGEAALPTSDTLSVVLATNGDRAVFERGVRGVNLRVERSNGTRVNCRLAVCSSLALNSVSWISGSDALLLRVRDADGVDELSAWKIGTGQAHIVTRAAGTLDGGLASGSTCTTTQQAAICVEAAPVSPPRLVRVDLHTGARLVLADPNQSLRSRISTTAALRHWHAEGHDFSGVLLTPGTPLPRAPSTIRISGLSRITVVAARALFSVIGSPAGGVAVTWIAW